MKTIIAAFLLTFTCLNAWAQQKPQRETSLSLRISADPANKYVEGEPIPIRLTFKNVSKEPLTFTLAEKDNPTPGFITARVWDSKGNLLTRNDTLEDGWWTVWIMVSSTYKEKESDRVNLNAGEEYTRTINLQGLLFGCPGLPSGLKAGTYKIQFALAKDVSNEMVISIERK